MGIANNRYFSHHPERGGRKGGVPEAKGLLDEEEVGELWEVFFGKIHGLSFGFVFLGGEGSADVGFVVWGF